MKRTSILAVSLWTWGLLAGCNEGDPDGSDQADDGEDSDTDDSDTEDGSDSGADPDADTDDGSDGTGDGTNGDGTDDDDDDGTGTGTGTGDETGDTGTDDGGDTGTDDGDDGDEPPTEYQLGAGVYDITGPPADVVMMGYADGEQSTQGISMRLRARAFIVGDGEQRVAFVSADLGQIFLAVKQGVVAALQADPELADLYRDDNVLLSATHTHGGPGGYSHHFLYNTSVGGFVEQNHRVIVSGIVEAIRRAHQNLEPGTLQLGAGKVEEGGWQRSRLAFLRNPPTERELYEDGDTDKTMPLLKFVSTDGEDLGLVAWFAVHPTAMSPFNYLITGDLHGYASWRFEQDMGTDYAAERTFVAAFAQTNAGDVSPNIKYGVPDGTEDFAHLQEFGDNQYDTAKALFASDGTGLAGPVEVVHTYVDMPTVTLENGTQLCVAALGASFSAGSTEDNVSPAPLYDEGVTTDDLTITGDLMGTLLQLLLGAATGVIWPDSVDDATAECHGKKPILLPNGAGRFEDQPLSSQIVPLQLVRIGQLAIIGQPSEITTMAGRRLRNTVLQALAPVGVTDVIIAGLSNGYTQYVTTPEEYGAQHYEGASTHFGPNTLPGYQHEFSKLAAYLVDGETPPVGPIPPDMSDTGYVTEATVDEDTVPEGLEFGAVETDASASYQAGDVVEVVFLAGYPNNNLKTQSSYLWVETESGTMVADDGHFSTTIAWARTGTENRATVRWTIPQGTPPGNYRIRHEGHAKNQGGSLTPYEGTSAVFEVR